MSDISGSVIRPPLTDAGNDVAGNVDANGDCGHIVIKKSNIVRRNNQPPTSALNNINIENKEKSRNGAAIASLSVNEVVGLVGRYQVPFVFAVFLIFFMGVEYTIRMVPFDSPPLDIGFIFTQSLHGFIAARPALNSILAALNTIFVVMQSAYILWTLLVEGRPRPTIATLFMFTCRGILGCSTQLPLPQDFLGSGLDFPIGNVSFFLFFSGHVAGAVVASLDMRRMGRLHLSYAFDTLNVLQGLRLLATRGHYTIDLAIGVGAGILSDSLAGSFYEKSKRSVCCHCR